MEQYSSSKIVQMTHTPFSGSSVHKPDGARILTSSTDLNVLPTDEYQGSAGGDAGTWITPLTGRPVILLPFHTDLSQSQTLEILCGQQINFIYVGKTGYSFNDAAMNAQPDAYTLLLDLPKAKIYEVTGCKSLSPHPGN